MMIQCFTVFIMLFRGCRVHMVRFIFVLLSVSCSLYGANPPPAAPQFNWNGSTSSMATGSNSVGDLPQSQEMMYYSLPLL